MTLTKVATPAEGMPQLLGGKVQFALMDMTVPAVARSKGVPLVLVAPAPRARPPRTASESATSGSRADSPIKTMKDVQNATFGIPQINSQIWVDIRSAVDEAGGDSSKIKFVEVPNTLVGPQGRQRRRHDDLRTCRDGGPATTAPSTGSAGYTAAGADLAYAYVTTQEFAQRNPNTVKAFEQSILKANSAVNADEATRVQVASTYVKAPKALLEKAHYPGVRHGADQPVVGARRPSTVWSSTACSTRPRRPRRPTCSSRASRSQPGPRQPPLPRPEKEGESRWRNRTPAHERRRAHGPAGGGDQGGTGHLARVRRRAGSRQPASRRRGGR